MENFNPHKVIWNDEKIKRFWDFRAENDLNGFFSGRYGNGILNLVANHVKVKGNVLDYGCGKGHLLENLLNRYPRLEQVYGFEFNEKSIEETTARLENNDKFKGCQSIKLGTNNYTGFKDNFFDFVFIIEVVEHLSEEYLESTLKEINRIIKEDGIIILTTPNNENLDKKSHMCPDCGCTFHDVQHMGSFDVSSISRILRDKKFKEIEVKETHYRFHNYGKILSPLIRSGFSVYKKVKGSDIISPHLFYMGRKVGQL